MKITRFKKAYTKGACLLLMMAFISNSEPLKMDVYAKLKLNKPKIEKELIRDFDQESKDEIFIEKEYRRNQIKKDNDVLVSDFVIETPVLEENEEDLPFYVKEIGAHSMEEYNEMMDEYESIKIIDDIDELYKALQREMGAKIDKEAIRRTTEALNSGMSEREKYLKGLESEKEKQKENNQVVRENKEKSINDRSNYTEQKQKIEEEKIEEEVEISVEPVTPDKPIIETDNYFEYQENSLFVEDVYKMISNLSEPIKQHTIDTGLKVSLIGSDGYIERLYNIHPVTGLTDYSKNQIYIESYIKSNARKLALANGADEEVLNYYSDEEYSKIIVKDTIMHEIAHVFNKHAGNYANSDEFRNIFEKEKDNFKETTMFKIVNMGVESNVRTQDEYFATAFASLQLYPTELRRNCPLTYNFINDYINYSRVQEEPKVEIIIK